MKRLAVIFLILAAIRVNAEPLQFQATLIPESPPNASVMAAYFNVSNQDKQDRAIIEIVSPEFEKVEIHQTIINDGVAKMEQLNQIIIPANDTLKLEPGGIHLMLINPKQSYRADEMIILKLIEKDKTEHVLAITIKKNSISSHHHHE